VQRVKPFLTFIGTCVAVFGIARPCDAADSLHDLLLPTAPPSLTVGPITPAAPAPASLDLNRHEPGLSPTLPPALTLRTSTAPPCPPPATPAQISPVPVPLRAPPLWAKSPKLVNTLSSNQTLRARWEAQSRAILGPDEPAPTLLNSPALNQSLRVWVEAQSHAIRGPDGAPVLSPTHPAPLEALHNDVPPSIPLYLKQVQPLVTNTPPSLNAEPSVVLESLPASLQEPLHVPPQVIPPRPVPSVLSTKPTRGLGGVVR
jgi:hypothetical protein